MLSLRLAGNFKPEGITMVVFLETKKCTKCKSDVPLLQFNKRTQSRSGYTSECRDCQKKYRTENRERILLNLKEYRQNNLKKRRLYVNKNRAKINEQKRAYWHANKERVARQAKESRSRNNTNIRKYKKEKYKNDYEYKLKHLLRSRLLLAIKGNHRTGSAVRDLGCSILELKQHLESQFDDAMTWSNWGEVWHLDHVYPLAAANLDDRTEFLAVNNWRNLQPLSVKENLEKNDKVTPDAQKLFEKLCKDFS